MLFVLCVVQITCQINQMIIHVFVEVLWLILLELSSPFQSDSISHFLDLAGYHITEGPKEPLSTKLWHRIWEIALESYLNNSFQPFSTLALGMR